MDAGDLAPLLAAPAGSPARIGLVAIPTRDRPRSLARSLGSLIGDLARSGRRAEVAVFDDTCDPASGARTRDLAERIGRRRGRAIRYAGGDEKRSFAKRLASCGIDPEAVQFALQPPVRYAGANRNAMLLHAAGRAFASFDDDTVCRLAAPPGAREGLRIASGDPCELWPSAGSRPVQGDAVASLESVLGRTAGACVRAHGGVRLGRLSPALLAGLRSGEARAAVTALGVRGDLGLGGGAPLLLLRLPAPSRGRLVLREAAYRRVMAGGAALRSAPGLTLADGASHLFMTTACAFDHRALLPPFFPVCRGDDPLFAHELTAVAPETLIAHLPLAIEHRRPAADTRRAIATARDRVRRGARDLPIYLVLVLCVRAFECGARGRSARTRALGRHLQAIGALSPSDFGAAVGAAWAEVLVDVHRSFRALLEEADGPVWWRRDVERYADYLGAQGTWAAATDVGAEARRLGCSAEAATRRLVSAFGRLLAAWPDMVAAARDLRARGEGLLSPV